MYFKYSAKNSMDEVEDDIRVLNEIFDDVMNDPKLMHIL